MHDWLQPYRQRLLELLRTYSFERRPVLLASGRRSDFYIDCRRTVLLPEGQFLTGLLLSHMVQEEFGPVDGVGGMAVGAVPIVSAVCLTSFLATRPLQGFYVRKEAKGHGTQRRVEASALLGSGSRVVLLEDVVTTGGSSLDAARTAEEELGVEVAGIVALVDRQEGGAERIEERYPFRALFGRSDFLASPSSGETR